MKNSVLLIVLLLVFVMLRPVSVSAEENHWLNKFKSFFQSSLPTDLKFCVDYEGEFYAVGKIFKIKDCKKWDKEINLGGSGLVGPQGPQGIQGEKGDKGDNGSQGQQGIPGVAGVDGKDGQNGIIGWEKVSTVSASTTDQLKTVDLSCPLAKKVLSGGFKVNSSTVTYYTVSNFPSSENTWTVSVHRSSTATPWDITVYAICATVPY